MGHNYQKNNANIGKLVMTGNFIEFPIKWRKPHCSKFICLEMTSRIKFLLQVEIGEKIAYQNCGNCGVHQLMKTDALTNRAITTKHSAWHQVVSRLSWKKYSLQTD